MEVYGIPLKDIQPDSDINVRHTDKDKGIDELAASIKAMGLLQPIVLLGENDKPPYKIMVGQRRFLAHKKLGETTIKAIFEKGLNKDGVLLFSD